VKSPHKRERERERERERRYDTVIKAKLGTCFPIRRKCKKKEETIRQQSHHVPINEKLGILCT
jgi:hypothetical protein